MAHFHQHREQEGTKNIRLAFFINFFFTIIEIIGGIYTNSLAVISDALFVTADEKFLRKVTDDIHCQHIRDWNQKALGGS